MITKYKVGDLLTHEGKYAEIFHILIEGISEREVFDEHGMAWPYDVYHIRILEDDEPATISIKMVDNDVKYTKVA